MFKCIILIRKTVLNINGIAHIALSVKNISKSKVFYNTLLPFLGLTRVHEGDKSIYHVGARTGIMIQQIDENMDSANFNQNNIGLHHFCFRARERKDIDLLGNKLKEMKAVIIRGPLEGNWAPGYYYILFEDPDGIRLEVNYVPGEGVLDKNNKFNSNRDYL